MIWCISHRKTDHIANRSRFCRRIADARLMQKRLSNRRQAENLRSPFSILKKNFVKIFYFPNCINMQFLGPNGLVRYLRLRRRESPGKRQECGILPVTKKCCCRPYTTKAPAHADAFNILFRYVRPSLRRVICRWAYVRSSPYSTWRNKTAKRIPPHTTPPTRCVRPP